MKILTSFLTVTFLSCAGSQTATKSEPPPVSQIPEQTSALAQAQRLIQVGQGPAAQIQVEKHLESNPEDAKAYGLLGHSLAMQSKLPEAANAYEKARQLGSSDPQVWIELSSLYDVAKNYKASTQVYEDYLTQWPDDFGMRHQFGLTLILAQDYPKAITQLESAHTETNSAHDVAQDLGYAYLLNKNFEKARRTLTPVVKAKGIESPVAMRFLAQAEAGTGRVRQALTLLKQLLEARPDDVLAKRLYGKLTNIKIPKERK